MIVDVVDCARESGMTDMETEIVSSIVFDALGRGVTRVGGLLDELDQLGPAGRREVLDRARQEVGLPSTATVDAQAAAAAAPSIQVSSAPLRDMWGRPLQSCHEPGCGAFPQDQHGAVLGSNAVAWFCPAHREGHEEEMKDRESPKVLALPGGGFYVEDETEVARARHEDERIREEFERRQAEHEAEVEVIRRAEERNAERYRTDAYLNPFLGPGWAGKV